VSERKYSVASIGARIDGFLRPTLRNAGFQREFRNSGRSSSADDFETPGRSGEVQRPRRGPGALEPRRVAARLEHVTMEMLRIALPRTIRAFPSTPTITGLLRIEELRLSAEAAAEKVKRTGVPFRASTP